MFSFSQLFLPSEKFSRSFHERRNIENFDYIKFNFRLSTTRFFLKRQTMRLFLSKFTLWKCGIPNRNEIIKRWYLYLWLLFLNLVSEYQNYVDWLKCVVTSMEWNWIMFRSKFCRESIKEGKFCEIVVKFSWNFMC